MKDGRKRWASVLLTLLLMYTTTIVPATRGDSGLSSPQDEKKRSRSEPARRGPFFSSDPMSPTYTVNPSTFTTFKDVKEFYDHTKDAYAFMGFAREPIESDTQDVAEFKRELVKQFNILNELWNNRSETSPVTKSADEKSKQRQLRNIQDYLLTVFTLLYFPQTRSDYRRGLSLSDIGIPQEDSKKERERQEEEPKKIEGVVFMTAPAEDIPGYKELVEPIKKRNRELRRKTRLDTPTLPTQRPSAPTSSLTPTTTPTVQQGSSTVSTPSGTSSSTSPAHSLALLAIQLRQIQIKLPVSGDRAEIEKLKKDFEEKEKNLKEEITRLHKAVEANMKTFQRQSDESKKEMDELLRVKKELEADILNAKRIKAELLKKASVPVEVATPTPDPSVPDAPPLLDDSDAEAPLSPEPTSQPPIDHRSIPLTPPTSPSSPRSPSSILPVSLMDQIRNNNIRLKKIDSKIKAAEEKEAKALEEAKAKHGSMAAAMSRILERRHAVEDDDRGNVSDDEDWDTN